MAIVDPTPDYVPRDTLRRLSAARARGYKYLSVDASTMQITNEFEFANVQYSFQHNAAGEFSGSLDLYSSDAKFLIPQQTYIVVERMGVPFWCGFMWKPRRNGKILDVEAQGVWSLFGHRHIRDTKSYFNTDRAVIVKDLVQYAQLGFGGDLHVSVPSVTLPSTPLGEAFYPWWEDKVISSEVENLALMDPQFSFSIEGRWLPGNVLAFDFVMDPVHPHISPHAFMYGGNVDDYEWEPIAPSPNHVDAFGGFDGPAMIRRTAQNFQALENGQPRIEVSTGNRDILTEQPVEALALSTIKKTSGAPAQPVVVMQASSDPHLDSMKVGQEVQVDIDDGYVQVHGRYVIDRIEVVVPDGAADAPGSETIRLSFENLVDDALISAV